MEIINKKLYSQTRYYDIGVKIDEKRTIYAIAIIYNHKDLEDEINIKLEHENMAGELTDEEKDKIIELIENSF